MLRNYNLIVPPYVKHAGQTPTNRKNAKETTQKEAQNFLSWLLQTLPQRFDILKKVLKDTGYNPQRLDFSEGSLDYLDGWFSEHISTRTLTKNEKETEIMMLDSVTLKKGKLKIPLKDIREIPTKVLTYETESLCYDVGLYFASMLEKNVSGLKWEFVKKPKSSVFYHHPVLTGFIGGPLEPQHVMAVIALNKIEKNKAASNLKTVYDIYKSQGPSYKGKSFWNTMVESIPKKEKK